MSTATEGNRPRTWVAFACAIAILVLVVTALSAAAGQPDPRMQRARALFQERRFEESRALLAEVLVERPDDAEAHLLLGRVALQSGELERAEEHLVFAHAGQTRLPFMASYALGTLRMLQRDFSSAETALTDAVERAPRFPLARLARARAALFSGHRDVARTDIETLRASQQVPPAGRLLHAELLLLEGNNRAAMAELQTLSLDASDSTAATTARLYLDTYATDPAETADRVRAVLRHDLNHPHPLFWLGIATAAAGDVEQARSFFRAALAIDDLHVPSFLALARLAGSDPGAPVPGSLDPAILPEPLPSLQTDMERAWRYLADDDLEAAAVIAHTILDVRPRFLPARLALLQVAEQRGDRLQGIVELQDLLELVPGVPDLLVDLALLAQDVGAHATAATALREALALREDLDGSLHFMLGAALAATGEVDDAMAACETALELGYDSSAVYITLGNLHHERMEISEAIAALRQAVERDPAAAEQIAGFALTVLTAADSALVVEMLEAAVSAQPGNVNTLYALGSQYLRTGELELT